MINKDGHTIFNIYAKSIGIQEFKERILTRSGGISASNLYQFSIDAGEGGMRQYLADNNFTGTDTGDDIVNLIFYVMKFNYLVSHTHHMI